MYASDRRKRHSTDLADLTAAELADGYRRHEFSPREAVEACLRRIHALDPQYRAFVTVAEDALEQADRASDLLASNDERPLAGIPVALKDLSVTAGLRTTFGSLIFADNIPKADDIVSARLKSAGAIILGKTNTPEFGYGAITDNKLVGPTANPYDPTYTSGGSSGGSATAVALGMVPVALGSDLGGSVRMPASFCGIVGLRPAIGTIPTVPRTRIGYDFIAPGTFGRTVHDAAWLAEALSGPDVRDPASLRAAAPRHPASGPAGARRFRIAASADLGIAAVDRDVAGVFERAVGRLREAHDVADVAPPIPDGFQQAYEILRGAMICADLGPLVARHGEALSPTLRWNVSRGENLTAAELMWAEDVRMRAYLALTDFLTTHDAIATLAAPVAAFPIEQREVLEINGKPLRNIIDYSAVALIGTMTGFPCISLPCGFNREGMPVGLQLICRADRQNDLVALATQLEQELDFGFSWPPAAHADALPAD